VLLWFGAFKNGGPGYAPVWVAISPVFRASSMREGVPLAALSPFAQSTLAADRTAFAALMRHLPAKIPITA
jgi:hypothetical protein